MTGRSELEGASDDKLAATIRYGAYLRAQFFASLEEFNDKPQKKAADLDTIVSKRDPLYNDSGDMHTRVGVTGTVVQDVDRVVREAPTEPEVVQLDTVDVPTTVKGSVEPEAAAVTARMSMYRTSASDIKQPGDVMANASYTLGDRIQKSGNQDVLIQGVAVKLGSAYDHLKAGGLILGPEDDNIEVVSIPLSATQQQQFEGYRHIMVPNGAGPEELAAVAYAMIPDVYRYTAADGTPAVRDNVQYPCGVRRLAFVFDTGQPVPVNFGGGGITARGVMSVIERVSRRKIGDGWMAGFVDGSRLNYAYGTPLDLDAPDRTLLIRSEPRHDFAADGDGARSTPGAPAVPPRPGDSYGRVFRLDVRGRGRAAIFEAIAEELRFGARAAVAEGAMLPAGNVQRAVASEHSGQPPSSGSDGSGRGRRDRRGRRGGRGRGGRGDGAAVDNRRIIDWVGGAGGAGPGPGPPSPPLSAHSGDGGGGPGSHHSSDGGIVRAQHPPLGGAYDGVDAMAWHDGPPMDWPVQAAGVNEPIRRMGGRGEHAGARQHMLGGYGEFRVDLARACIWIDYDNWQGAHMIAWEQPPWIRNNDMALEAWHNLNVEVGNRAPAHGYGGIPPYLDRPGARTHAPYRLLHSQDCTAGYRVPAYTVTDFAGVYIGILVGGMSTTKQSGMYMRDLKSMDDNAYTRFTKYMFRREHFAFNLSMCDAGQSPDLLRRSGEDTARAYMLYGASHSISLVMPPPADEGWQSQFECYELRNYEAHGNKVPYAGQAVPGKWNAGRTAGAAAFGKEAQGRRLADAVMRNVYGQGYRVQLNPIPDRQYRMFRYTAVRPGALWRDIYTATNVPERIAKRTGVEYCSYGADDVQAGPILCRGQLEEDEYLTVVGY